MRYITVNSPNLTNLSGIASAFHGKAGFSRKRGKVAAVSVFLLVCRHALNSINCRCHEVSSFWPTFHGKKVIVLAIPGQLRSIVSTAFTTEIITINIYLANIQSVQEDLPTVGGQCSMERVQFRVCGSTTAACTMIDGHQSIFFNQSINQ